MTPDAEALRVRAFAAFEAGRLAEAVVCFDGLLRLANIPKFYAAQALYNMSVAFGLLDNLEAEIAACQELILRFGAAEEPQIETLLASALVNKGVALIRLGRPDLALDSFAEVVARFADAEAPALREQVEKALVDSGAVLSEQGRHSDALAQLAQALPRLAARRPSLRCWSIKATAISSSAKATRPWPPARNCWPASPATATRKSKPPWPWAS